jgi:CxxC-x17-CxxC domain-containing protein
MERFNRSGGFDRGRGGKPGFKKGGFKSGFGRPSFGGKGGRDRGDVEMFSATCANCGKACEVPFRPSGDRPIYCKDCFQKDGGNDRGGGGFERRAPARTFERRDNPTYPRPTASSAQDPRIDGIKRQIDDISAKLDLLLKLNEKSKNVPVAAKSDSKEKVAKPAEKEVKAPSKKKKSVKKK